jgi:hypothetical protein
MRTFILLTLASLAIAACSVQTKTVEHQPDSGARTVTTSTTSIGTTD